MYTVSSYSLLLFLGDEFSYSEAEANWTYWAYALLTTAFGLVVGIFVDQVGVKWSIISARALVCISHLACMCATDVRALLVVLFTLQPLGNALGTPALLVGVKRYTRPDNRTLAFSLFYVMMNLAAITIAPGLDSAYALFPATNLVLNLGTGHAYSMPTHRLVLLGCALANFAALLMALIGIRESSEAPMLGEHRYHSPVSGSGVMREVVLSGAFWRLFLLLLVVQGVRMLHLHVDETFPTYMRREFGQDVMYGSIMVINPLCICLIVPLVAPLAMSVHPLRMMLLGSVISSLAPSFLTGGSHYTEAIFFVTTLSLGECLLQPRLSEYLTTAAPPGR